MDSSELFSIRQKLGWTQQNVADFLRIGDRTRVSEMESGKRRIRYTEAVLLRLLVKGRLDPEDLEDDDYDSRRNPSGFLQEAD
jgi:transcriptional regulator with XRE-family HTH domain